MSPTVNRGHVLTPAGFRPDAGCSPDVTRRSRVRRRVRVAQAIIAALIMMPSAGRGDSQQSMNQSGMAKDGAHVTFAPPFPAPPDVNMFVPDIEKYTAQLIVCMPRAVNVTTTGFDYRADCRPTAHPEAVWLATWMAL